MYFIAILYLHSIWELRLLVRENTALPGDAINYHMLNPPDDVANYPADCRMHTPCCIRKHNTFTERFWNYFIKAIGTMRSKEDFVHEKTNHMNYTTVNNNRLISIAILLIRVWMGVVLFYAGAGKLYGWFGGFGMETTIKYFAQTGINTFFSYVSCYTEFIGGFLLVLGLFTRPVAFAVTINMLVAVWVTAPGGFFTMAGYPFTLMINSIAVLLTGAMAYSLDALVFGDRKRIKL